MSQPFERTFRLDRLFFRYIKPNDIKRDLYEFAEALESAGFIKVSGDRYSETLKLTSKAHKQEFFALLQSLKTPKTYKPGPVLKTLALAALAALTTACSTQSKPQGFILPPALSETFRGGALKGLENADSPALGMPNQYDQVRHTCTSAPLYDLDGRFLRTDVRCW